MNGCLGEAARQVARCEGTLRRHLVWRGFAACVLWLVGAAYAWAGETPRITETLLRVKPAVAMVVTEISGEVRLACPGAAPQRLVPDPIRSHGTGFLISADGYLVTNAHVVQPYYESNDPEARDTFLRQAAERACVPANLTAAAKRQAVRGLLPRIAARAKVEVKRTLSVVLSNRETFVGEIKAYSPPLAEQPGKQGGTAGATESGKDVAIVKIDGRNLPTLPLADSDRVQLGQRIHLFGFPGVVLYHDLLDKRSAVEVSVTSGLVSSEKRDARGAPVLQTDAAASWGNSGGPAVNDQGEVIGILTFISLTSDETQAIQGFNFLVPANIVREFARTAGARLGESSPFDVVWHDAVARFLREDWAGALAKADAAARLVANLRDVQRLQAEAQVRLLQDSRRTSQFSWAVAIGGILAATGGAWWVWQRRKRGRPRLDTTRAPEREAPPSPPVRVSAPDLARALAQRTDLVILDVRDTTSYAGSSVQAKGAIRAGADDVREVCSGLAHHQGIVLYGDAAGDGVTTRAASQLIAAGYTRVAVLTGGFEAWEGASLPLERTPHARGIGGAPQPALPLPSEGEHVQMDVDVDLPVGVKGVGPYFNARATRLGLSGLSLKSVEALTVGQRLRLTIFLAGESLEIGGHVLSSDSQQADGQQRASAIAFDPLGEEQKIALEGFILAQRTGQNVIR